MLGTQPAALSVLLLLLLSYPLGYALRIHTQRLAPDLRHVIHVLLGFSYAYACFGWHGILHPLFAATTTYALIALLPAFPGAAAAVVFNGVYILERYHHVSSAATYDVDYTTVLCMFTLRLMSLAIDRYDGAKLMAKFRNARTTVAGTSGGDPKDAGTFFSPVRRGHRGEQTSRFSAYNAIALIAMPSYLEVLGYVFYPFVILTGPPFPFALYLRFVEGDLYGHSTPRVDALLGAQRPVPLHSAPDTDPLEQKIHAQHVIMAKAEGRPPPAKTAIRPAMRNLMTGMAYMLIYQLVGSYFPVSRLVSPEFLDPQHHSLLYRVVIMLVTARVHATMYYAIWQLTEGALTMHGISFNGYEPESGSPLFTGLENLNVASLELATSLAGVISGFNMRTNEWTKHYAFKRIGLALGSRMGGQFLSLLWLCVWHGTAFGYFATFGLEFAMMTALTIANSYTADYRAWMDANHATDRQAKRHRLAFKAASWAVTWIWLSGGFTPFHLKSFERCAIAFKGGYWVIPAWVGLVILVNVPMKRFYLHGRRKARIEYSQSSTPASTMAAMTETTTTESKKMS